MTMRYFEVHAPRNDFTGRVGGVSFADGVARVQFGDLRDDRGVAVAEEHQVSPGRSLVLFAQRRPGYSVTELDANGRPVEDEVDEPKADKVPNGRSSAETWRAYAVSQGMDSAEAEKLSRDELIAHYAKENGK
jgi:hypothetical protein